MSRTNRYALLVLLALLVILFFTALASTGASNASGAVILGLVLTGWGVFAFKRRTRTLVDVMVGEGPTKVGSGITAGTGIVLCLLALPVWISGIARERQEREEAAAAAEKGAAAANKRAAAAKKRETQRIQMAGQAPAKIAAWKEKLTALDTREGMANITATIGDVETIRAEADALAAALGKLAPAGLATLRQEASKKYEELKAVQDFLQTSSAITLAIDEGRKAINDRQWLPADAALAEALQGLDKLDRAPQYLKRHVPANFESAKERQEAERLRNQIARQVATAQEKQEHERRLARIEVFKAGLRPGERSSFVAAQSALTAEINACGRCKASRALAAALGEVDDALERWPRDIGSIQELQNRYADLKNRPVRVPGDLSVATYYNCRFRSERSWRSFQLASKPFSGLHVYCSRGDEDCESVFQHLASGGSERGTAIVEYPSSNSVCKNGQAYLRGWTRDSK